MLLGHDGEATRFENFTQSIRMAFVREYYGPNPSMVPNQTIQAMAVQWGVLPREH